MKKILLLSALLSVFSINCFAVKNPFRGHVGPRATKKDVTAIIKNLKRISGVGDIEIVTGLVVNPNPVSDISEIYYNLQEKAIVNIEIYDVTGSMIKVILNEYQSRGEHKVQFDANNLNSGVYLLNFKAGEQVVIKKLIVTK